MNLETLQRTMARAVMQPLTPADRMRRSAPDGRSMRSYAARFIKPNDRMTSFERLEIYNQQYWWRVLSSLMEDFPGLRALVGARRFEELCKAYLVDCPSRSYTLRDLGSRLEAWLRRHPRWAGRRLVLALDIVSLEWAEIEAFDGPAEPVFRPEDLGTSSKLPQHLRLQPYIRLLSFHYPVDDLLLKIRENGDEKDVASNAFQERRKQKRIRAVAKLKPAPIFLAVHRMDDTVYFRRLEEEEFIILRALQEGKSINQALVLAIRKKSGRKVDWASSVERWFRNWAALGWVCAPAKDRRGV
jgi:hypothetical protein